MSNPNPTPGVDLQRALRRAALALVFMLLLAPESRAADCPPCNLIRRDCHSAAQNDLKRCVSECRGQPDAERRGCVETCQQARKRTRTDCALNEERCAQACEEATDPACPRACVEPLRECTSEARRTRSDCGRKCRAASSPERVECRGRPESDRGPCLRSIGMNQDLCSQACQGQAQADVTACHDRSIHCLAACSGG